MIIYFYEQVFPFNNNHLRMTYIYKKISALFLIVFLLSISQNIFAQKRKLQDVLWLENGDKITGHIIQQTEEIIKIRLYGGSEITYQLHDIKEISEETFKKPIFFKVKEKGYFNTSTISVQLIPINNDGLFSLHSINGYQFSPYFAVGLGIGIDNYDYYDYDYNYNNRIHKYYTTFLSISGDMNNTRKFTPTYSLEHGYGARFIQNFEDQKGGFYFNYGLGFKLRSKSTFDWIFSLNYQNQSGINGIMIRTGFSF